MKNLFYSFILVFALFLTGCANAGKDQTVNAGDTVTLDANASSANVGGEIKAYKWMQIKGPRVTTLSNASSIQATFTSPTVSEDITLTFKLSTIEYGGRPNRFRSYDTVNILVKATTSEVDTQAPVITLNGAESITLNIGDTYNEEDASAVDNIDGAVDVNITSNVNTAQEGNYTVTYMAKDMAGNVATKERTVIVEDTQVEGITVSGQVTDINGTAISGAIVSIQGKHTSTDTNGTYSIDNIEASERVSIDVVHPDYLANSRILAVGDVAATLDIVLGVAKATTTFDALTGTTLTETSGASVALPANGYIDENGNPYIGSIIVKMAYYAISTQSGRDTFPGTFEGIDENGTNFPIVSYGFMNVELSDMRGNPLNLDGNATATLTYPNDYSLNTPSVVLLGYYDEALGYWIQEGEATNEGHDDTYIGTVTHFTAWNLNATKYITVKGTLWSWGGDSISTESIYIASSWDNYYHGIPVPSITTNPDGHFSTTFEPNDSLSYIVGSDFECNPVFIQLVPNINTYDVGDIMNGLCM